MDIEEKIKQLPVDRQKLFRKRLENALYDRGWCIMYGIDYTNPNVSRAKEVLFKEEYEGYLPKAI